MKTKIIQQFERDMHLALDEGYFLSISIIEPNQGLELFLTQKINEFRARSVCNFISQKYNFETVFYIKTNSIKVFYV